MEITIPVQHSDVFARNEFYPLLPREPDDAMRDALVHIAFGSWNNVWEGHGGIARVHWVIVAHDIRTGARVHTSNAGRTHPMEEILADIHRAIADARCPVWVVIPKKRRGVAGRLYSDGVPLSVGLTAENRASPILIEAIAAESIKQFHEAIQSGAVHPQLGVKRRRVMPRLSLPKEPPTRYWWPIERRVRAKQQSDIVVAADASRDQFGACGLGVVTDSGDAIAKAGQSDVAIGELELEAITLALELVAEVAPGHAIVESDNADAVSVAKALALGRRPARGYCGISELACDGFRLALNSLDCSVEFVQVRGHNGDYLNEAADQIANMVRIATTHPRESIESQLAQRIDAVVETVVARGGVNASATPEVQQTGGRDHPPNQPGLCA